jgi:hypothetical protein
MDVICAVTEGVTSYRNNRFRVPWQGNIFAIDA